MGHFCGDLMLVALTLRHLDRLEEECQRQKYDMLVADAGGCVHNLGRREGVPKTGKSATSHRRPAVQSCLPLGWKIGGSNVILKGESG